MEDVLGEALERRIKIVTNAGGLNPEGLAVELRTLCDRLGLKAKILHIEGDDLMPQLESLQQAGHELREPRYGSAAARAQSQAAECQCLFGCMGHRRGARTREPKSSSARESPMLRWSSVRRPGISVGNGTDWDRLAGAVVAGHVVECGTQCTGGNYAFFQEVPGLERPGFPIVEVQKTDRVSSRSTKRPAGWFRSGP